MIPDAVTGEPTAAVQGAKKLWCNKTNGRTIAKLYGKTENWIGKRITLFPTDTRGAGGQTVPCIRVRPNEPKPRKVEE